MILPGGRVDDNIVNLSSSVLVMGPQDNIHKPLEGHWGSMEPKGENPILPMATGSAEGSLQPGIGCERHLPVVLCQVQNRDELGSPQPLDKVIHS